MRVLRLIWRIALLAAVAASLWLGWTGNARARRIEGQLETIRRQHAQMRALTLVSGSIAMSTVESWRQPDYAELYAELVDEEMRE